MLLPVAVLLLTVAGFSGARTIVASDSTLNPYTAPTDQIRTAANETSITSRRRELDATIEEIFTTDNAIRLMRILNGMANPQTEMALRGLEFWLPKLDKLIRLDHSSANPHELDAALAEFWSVQNSIRSLQQVVGTQYPEIVMALQVLDIILPPLQEYVDNQALAVRSQPRRKRLVINADLLEDDYLMRSETQRRYLGFGPITFGLKTRDNSNQQDDQILQKLDRINEQITGHFKSIDTQLAEWKAAIEMIVTHELRQLGAQVRGIAKQMHASQINQNNKHADEIQSKEPPMNANVSSPSPPLQTVEQTNDPLQVANSSEPLNATNDNLTTQKPANDSKAPLSQTSSDPNTPLLPTLTQLQIDRPTINPLKVSDSEYLEMVLADFESLRTGIQSVCPLPCNNNPELAEKLRSLENRRLHAQEFVKINRAASRAEILEELRDILKILPGK